MKNKSKQNRLLHTKKVKSKKKNRQIHSLNKKKSIDSCAVDHLKQHNLIAKSHTMDQNSTKNAEKKSIFKIISFLFQNRIIFPRSIFHQK